MHNLSLWLKEIAKNSSLVAKKIERYNAKKAVTSDWGVVNREKSLLEIKLLIEKLPDGIKEKGLAWYSEEESAIKRIKEEVRFNFGTKLKELLEKDGLALTGQLPILRAGLYSLRIDFDAGFSTLFFGPEIATLKNKIPLVPETIVKELTTHYRKLKGKDFNPQEFYKNLQKAYETHLLLTGHGTQDTGTKVFLVDLLFELTVLSQSKGFKIDPRRENFREYSRIQFGYDLFRLRNALANSNSPATMHLHIATFDATLDKAKAIWIPDNEQGQGTYYSYISFEK